MRGAQRAETIPIPKTIPIPRSDIADSEQLIGQQLFLYNDHGGEVHCLNSGAAIIWLLMDGRRSTAGIVAEITSTYGLPDQQVLDQVDQLVKRLECLGLLDQQSTES